MIEKIIKHTSGPGTFSISYNSHTSDYSTVNEYIKDQDIPDDDFYSIEEKGRCINNETIIDFCWYPNTPVGFYRCIASDIKLIEKFIDEIIEGDL